MIDALSAAVPQVPAAGVEARVLVTAGSRGMAALALAAATALSGAVLMGRADASTMGLVLTIAGLLALPIIAGARQLGWLSTVHQGRVSFDEAGLHLNDRLLLAASEVHTVVPTVGADTRGRLWVHRDALLPPVRIDVEDGRLAWPLVSLVSYGPGTRTSSCRLLPRWTFFVVHVTSCVAATLVKELTPYRFLSMLVAFAATYVVGTLVVTRIFARNVTVGSDGLAVGSRRRTQFLSFRDVGSIEQNRSGLTVSLRNGRKLNLSLGSGDRWRQVQTALQALFARYAALAGGSSNDAPPLSDARPYHNAANAADRLAAAVSNPTAQPAVRLRAAIRLCSEIDDGRDLVRAAIRDTASDELRKGLEAALASDTGLAAQLATALAESR